jgi:integrase
MVPAPSGISVSSRSRLRKTLWWWRAPCAWKATVKLGSWRNRSSEHVVPLSKIQIEILRLLAAHRDPESYVAGATPLNWNAARYSDDIDIGEGTGRPS